MKRIILGLFLFFSGLYGNEQTCDAYLKLVQEFPNLVKPIGDCSKGEIEIILDKNKMLEIEKKTGRTVGVVIYRDKNWTYINDACRFPSGLEGVHSRIFKGSCSTMENGVAVMPILPDGKIVLNCIYRHATRSWEIELPRGGRENNETIEDAARRETLEETGLVVDELILLGKIPPYTGMTSNIVPIFAAKIIKQCDTNMEMTEAIEKIPALSIDEIKESFRNGYYECQIRGITQKVNFRDPFLAYAILLYGLR